MTTDQMREIIAKVTGDQVTIQRCGLGFYAQLPDGVSTLTLYGDTEARAIEVLFGVIRGRYPFQVEERADQLRKAEQADALERFAAAETLAEYWPAYNALGVLIGTEELNGRLEEAIRLRGERSEINRVVGPKVEAAA